ncbi:hypothetical protein MMC21_002739 [Puttea exsequens]|nr:hypothetical protein [Puttea exsequens]
MAYDSQSHIDRLTAKPAKDLSPTFTPPRNEITLISSNPDRSQDGSSARPQEARPEKSKPVDGRTLSHPTSRASGTDLQWTARSQDAGHQPSQPIDIPQSSAHDGSSRPEDSGCKESESRYEEASPLEEYMRNRRPSISFHPQVTLDSGHHRPLDEPLPKLVLDTKARGRTRSVLQELECHPSKSPLIRSHSEADARNYDPLTGELFGSRPPQLNDTPRSPDNHSHWPFLDTTEYPPKPIKEEVDPVQGASLTSESTASPAVSEIQTPTGSMDILISPLSARSPFPSFPYPTSLDDSSAWPKQRRQPSASRSQSYRFERQSSMRNALRQGSKGSRRSTSSSTSPATAFLSRFAKQDSGPEPDSEGQEVGEYVVGKQVGFGGFSSVKEAYTLEGDERICRAVKIVRKQLPGKDEMENDALQAEFDHEVGLWRCLGHRNILPLIEVYVTDYATFCFTKLNTGGTLYDLVKANRQGISRDLARRYAYQLASAIRYLHEDTHIVHRDIKLENCLIDISDPASAKDGGSILLCDFGLAEFINSDSRRDSPDSYDQPTDRPPPRNIGPSDHSTSIAGSLQYASPELIMSPAGFLSPVADIWAFGVVNYAMLVGDLPFQHSFQPRVQMMILAGEYDMSRLEKAPGAVGYEEEVQEFVGGCLDMDSSRRWTISKVLKSRWLDGCQEMLEELSESWKL